MGVCWGQDSRLQRQEGWGHESEDGLQISRAFGVCQHFPHKPNTLVIDLLPGKENVLKEVLSHWWKTCQHNIAEQHGKTKLYPFSTSGMFLWNLVETPLPSCCNWFDQTYGVSKLFYYSECLPRHLVTVTAMRLSNCSWLPRWRCRGVCPHAACCKQKSNAPINLAENGMEMEIVLLESK